jgi:hypothetical protein
MKNIEFKGAGGTSGGTSGFFTGLIMMAVGFYMLLNKITITSGFGMGSSIYRFGGSYNLTTGMIFIPFIIGIIMIFYNSKKPWGWVLSVASLSAMIFGVISTVQIRMQSMSSFDAIIIFILAFGGLGMFLKSLKESNK